MKRIKAWLWERFLPGWAKHTVLRDLEKAEGRIRALERENLALRAYIRGMKRGRGIRGKREA